MAKKKSSKAAVPRGAKRQRRSSDDILNRIVRAARDEFKRSGFAGTTTATIARKADVTEAQLFRSFGSKANLFQETIFKPLDQQLLDFTHKHKLRSGDAGGTSKEVRNLYTTELQRFISDNAAMLTSLIMAQTYDSGATHGVGNIDSLKAYFDHGAAMMTSRLKGKPKVDPKLVVRLAFASVLASVMFKDWIFPAGLARDEEIEAAVNAFVMEGIGSSSSRS